MLNRSESANYAKAKFFEKFNDIDIFVEDTATESKKIYCEILSRALGHNFNITQVFPLGGKNAVINRCLSDQGARKRKAVYIIDGDYDILFGSSMPSLKRLYRLSRYSIENYLCDDVALIDVVSDESINLGTDEIAASFDFSGWKSHACTPLKDVVSACVVAYKRKSNGLPTVNVNLSDIRGRVDDHVDMNKVSGLVAKYELAIDSEFGNGAYSSDISSINFGGEDSFGFVRRYAPAKNLLLPFMISRANRKLGFTMGSKLLKCKLARRCDISELGSIVSFIS
jgi:hypothetical protein